MTKTKSMECSFTPAQYGYIVALSEQFGTDPQTVLRALVDACIKRDEYDSD